VTPTIVVPPAFEPVSWAEAQAWTHALDAEEDLVTGLIAAAREFCEHRKSQAFYEQTLEVTLAGWPARGYVRLPRARPLQSIESVKYLDEDGAEQTVSSSNYTSYAASGIISLSADFDRPSLHSYTAEPVTIQYVAGDNSSPLKPVSASVRLAMRQLIAHWYRNREGVIVAQSASVAASDLPMGIDALLGVDQQVFAF
jgi:uncharacterized phiE125 gp8 family phage protein